MTLRQRQMPRFEWLPSEAFRQHSKDQMKYEGRAIACVQLLRPLTLCVFKAPSARFLEFCILRPSYAATPSYRFPLELFY